MIAQSCIVLTLSRDLCQLLCLTRQSSLRSCPIWKHSGWRCQALKSAESSLVSCLMLQCHKLLQAHQQQKVSIFPCVSHSLGLRAGCDPLSCANVCSIASIACTCKIESPMEAMLAWLLGFYVLGTVQSGHVFRQCIVTSVLFSLAPCAHASKVN